MIELTPDRLLAVVILLPSVAVGLVLHEWLHALVLRLVGIEYTIVFGGERTPGVLSGMLSHPWAVVHPEPTGEEPAWHLRVAAMSPLLLALPTLTVATDFVIVPAHPAVTAILLATLACAIPSPQDFSVAFYAHSVLEDFTSPE
ncbi:hypothetical protein ACLI4U_09850 [Natrialbaceae archaeon A-CW2]|uniref:hypothetical protein n=1 Tax=Natronosalvus amylolyticus TaxID=2961994 RepID=UPI0020CA0876|nr:hypothetical protein [Natronosalvus amylolyticus]